MSSVPIELVPRREVDIFCFLFPILRFHCFFGIVSLISRSAIEWSSIRIIDFIFILDGLLFNLFGCIVSLIFRVSLEWDMPVLVLDPWYYLLPQLWFMPWVVLSIFGVDVIIRSVRLRF